MTQRCVQRMGWNLKCSNKAAEKMAMNGEIPGPILDTINQA